MKLHRSFVEATKVHRRSSRFEEHVVIERRSAIEDVFEIESSVGRDEDVLIQGTMFEVPKPVVACTMRFVGGVVADDGGEISDG